MESQATRCSVENVLNLHFAGMGKRSSQLERRLTSMIPYEKGKYPWWLYAIDWSTSLIIAIIVPIITVSLLHGRNPIETVEEILKWLVTK